MAEEGCQKGGNIWVGRFGAVWMSVCVGCVLKFMGLLVGAHSKNSDKDKGLAWRGGVSVSMHVDLGGILLV